MTAEDQLFFGVLCLGSFIVAVVAIVIVGAILSGGAELEEDQEDEDAWLLQALPDEPFSLHEPGMTTRQPSELTDHERSSDRIRRFRPET